MGTTKTPDVVADVDSAHGVDKDVGAVENIIDPLLEKKVLRKVDIYLLTLFGALYMMSALDRSNIGNAALTSFSEDLNLVGNQYGAAVSVVYSTYIFFEPICAVLLKILGPRNVMATSTLCWSAITIGTAFVKNFDQLAAVRVLLGAAEAAIIPCTSMYLTMAYNRSEYAVKKSYVQIAAAFSGAFGGLLAYGLTQINAAGLAGWQWMYLVEGIISMLLVPIVFLLLPNSPSEARWLKPEEKELMARRLWSNRGVYDEKEEFQWSEITRCLTDWKVYVQAVSHFGTNTTLFAVTTFMPRIIAGLGFTTKVNSQLLTVPVYFVSGLSFFLMARIADRRKRPSTYLLISLTCSLIGYIILIAVPHVGGRFFGLFVIAVGLYSAASFNVVWCMTMHAGYFKRALASGTMQMIGNVSGAVIGFIFTTQSAPRYIMGMWFAFSVTLLSMCCTLFIRYMLTKENKRRKELIAQGVPDQPELGDRNPHFQYYP